VSVLDPNRWRLVAPLFDRALELDAGERATWLAEIRRQKPALARDLQELLDARNALEPEQFLERPLPVSASATLAGQKLGAYTLVSPIGQGGMGSVWLARRSDGRFEGVAAVKLLNASLVGRAGEERFRREGSILARLRHPHIAHLVDAGVSPSGQPFLVLERVEGEPIDRYCESHDLGVEKRLGLFLDVLEAVAHAHANLIVHRDIKPSNVLVANDGEVKLLDFGIAKLLAEESGTGEATALTRDGGRALTPEYAAPEQVTGGTVTTATDVYALGVLLYVLLTGKHPAAASLRSPADLLRSIVETEPQRPSEAAPSDLVRRQLRGDLDTIVAKTLKKDSAERYASVTALAYDVRRYLGHRPIAARPDTPAYRIRKFVRRNRVAVALSTAAVLALCGGLVGTLTQARRATRQAAAADSQQRRADQEARLAGEQRDFALRQLSLAEDIIDLNSFVLSDATGGSEPIRPLALLARAEQIAERLHGSGENHVETLVAIGRQYLGQNENASAERLLTHAYEVAATLPDPTIRARAGCELASAIVYSGAGDRAEELIRSALSSLPDDPRYGMYRTQCLLRGCEIARWRGDMDVAIQRVEAARRLLKESPVPLMPLEVAAAMNLAESYRLSGRMREAREASEEAASRLEALGRGDTTTAGTVYNNWGLVLFALGRPLEAEKLLRRAIEIDGGIENARPMLVNNLARTLRDLHRLDEAARYAEKAHARAQRSGDQNVDSQALWARGGIYRERGELTRAAAMLSQLEASLPGRVPPGHVAFATLAIEQAMLAEAQENLDAALAAADRAVAIAEVSQQRAAYLPRMLLVRSEVELAAHRLAEARADAERSLAMAREASEPGKRSSSVGRAYAALARALRAEGDTDRARAAIASALEQFPATLGEDHAETLEARRLAATLGP